jgi:L-threonylcarbamoyladenylate synthase
VISFPHIALRMSKQALTPYLLPSDAQGIAQAVALLKAGEGVVLPTETVYGLAADATNAQAVARIYALKGRPAFNPLIVHVQNLEQALNLVDMPICAQLLAQAFWPGPLTLVLPAKIPTPIAPLVQAGLPTLGVRVPAHPLFQAVLYAMGKPLAAPSANRSGHISPTSPEHVWQSFGEGCPPVLPGAACLHGLESTIIGFVNDQAMLLRPGALSLDVLEAVLGAPIMCTQVQHNDQVPSAPGQLSSHYAPRQPVRLDALQAQATEWLIGFGAVAGHESLSRSGDLVEAAANLFACLHRAEQSGAAAIAVAPIPKIGLGLAINDRLARAAAAR